jgi:amidohydrolase
MTTTMTCIDQARQLQEEIVALRRLIHSQPELSFKEFETASIAAKKLSEYGYAVRTGVATTGIVADRGSGPRTVAIRADMDGLPIAETNQASYKSRNEGVMHACGHDAHVSCALAAAKILSQETLPGRLRMLMQPAEEDCDSEGLSGAKRMIQAGAMKEVDAVIGLHVDASIPAGKVAIQPGAVMAAADIFHLVITGKGGHGGYPEATIDTVVIAAQVIQALQQVVSRRLPPTEPAVVTVGSVHTSSTRGNVISETTELRGTLRTFSAAMREKTFAEVERACNVARALGADYKIEYELGYPPTINDPRVAEVMRKAAVDLIGAENVITIPPKTWAEDFSMLAEEAPGAFMFLGVEIAGDRRSHHSPNFDIDESGLYVGTAILAETARRLLKA